MDLETLFSASKWGILEHLAKERLSPLELAERLDTSVANISMQLRLLEAYGLVSKERMRNTKKGRPRLVFGIRKPFAYMVAAEEGFAKKSLIELDRHRMVIMRIWLEGSLSPAHQAALERFFLKNESRLIQQPFGIASLDGDTITITVERQEGLAPFSHGAVSVIPKKAGAMLPDIMLNSNDRDGGPR
ncbi:helix-turn-helix domain-containing protein [Candidatus Woesearchaeota archaeon]|nr:helix-turn-helix domain-containing protein [Candidatus Woesearchaeota archaeon]